MDPVRRLCRPLLLLAALAGMSALSCSHMPPETPRAPAGLEEHLIGILEEDVFRGVQVGVCVRSLDGSAPLVAWNDEAMMTPASTLKLFTSGSALGLLGPDYAFVTRLVRTGTLEDGVVHGDLLVLGSGDPTFPRTATGGLSIDLYEVWADILGALGVLRVEGQVVVLDPFFEDGGLGQGWCWDDQGQPFSAEVSGFNFADNCVRLSLSPGRAAGEPVSAWLWPNTRYVTLDNQVRTGEPGTPDSLEIRRLPCENVVRCTGVLGAGDRRVVERVAVVDPGLCGGVVLEETLKGCGIEVRGHAERRPSSPMPADTTWVTEHISPPLWEIAQRVNKESDNLYAETLLRTLGRELGDRGDTASGLTAVREFLRAAGIDSTSVVMVDGSGLSRLNAVSARAVADFLAFYASHDLFGDFYQSLSIASVDGTLHDRFAGTAAEGMLRGKTGSMAGVAALSGYAVDWRGDQIVFSFIANGYRADGGDLTELVDRLAVALFEFTP